MFDVRRALAALRRPGPATAYERGVVALDAGRHTTALAEFATAGGEATTPLERATIANKCGVALRALGRYDEALAAFACALEHDERHAPALVNLGNVLLEDGHVADAIDHYEAALRDEPGYAPAYRNLAVALRRAGRREEAVRALRSADRLAVRRAPGRA